MIFHEMKTSYDVLGYDVESDNRTILLSDSPIPTRKKPGKMMVFKTSYDVLGYDVLRYDVLGYDV